MRKHLVTLYSGTEKRERIMHYALTDDDYDDIYKLHSFARFQYYFHLTMKSTSDTFFCVSWSL